ncbi:MAG TPA: hypothetical protein DDZ44_05540, partial [Syntrophomonas wolfei]|nr:hypothetical protein [Syntrophomonas wolfei]
GTGLEHKAARDSGAVVIAKKAGTVKKASASRITIENDDGTKDNYELLKFMRSNQGTCYNQRPIVKVGERVEANEVIADGPSTEHGELALGRNVMVAFMPWEG